MIALKQYDGVVFHDLNDVFVKTNMDFYNHIHDLGMNLNFHNKDQQKIYLHYFIVYLCNCLKASNDRIIFHTNTFQMCDIHYKMMKKVTRIFGIRIWESPYSLSTIIVKLHNRDVEVVDRFEIWLNTETKQKTFKHIKKYLDKEGFTGLSDSYFQDIANKMSVMC
jgi:hypothetical protein